jgi:hypothetical protein
MNKEDNQTLMTLGVFLLGIAFVVIGLIFLANSV